MHPVFIIVFIDVVSNAVVVVVKRRGDAFEQLNSVGQSIAVPVVISPVDDAVVVVVPGGLFFTPETAEEFLVNVRRPSLSSSGSSPSGIASLSLSTS